MFKIGSKVCQNERNMVLGHDQVNSNAPTIKLSDYESLRSKNRKLIYITTFHILILTDFVKTFIIMSTDFARLFNPDILTIFVSFLVKFF